MSINDLSRVDASVSELADEFTRWISHPCVINAYLTPANGKTFGWHWDGHDVFIFQVEGRKRWEIFDAEVSYASNAENLLAKRFPELGRGTGRKIADLVLEQGDILYIPSGFPHDVTALPESHSLHLTVGLKSPRWNEAFSELFSQVLAKNAQALEFRMPAWGLYDWKLPKGAKKQFDDLLGRTIRELKKISLAEIYAEMNAKMNAERRFSSVERSSNLWKVLTGQKKISKHDQFTWTRQLITITRYGDFIRVQTGKDVLIFHPCAAAALNFIRRKRRFRLCDLPGIRLNQARELVTSLIERGCLDTDSGRSTN